MSDEISNEIENYEEVHVYPLDDDVREDILQKQNELTFIWGPKDHWAVGVLMSYVWRDGSFWVSATSQRKRISAIRRDPRVSVTVSSVGTDLGPSKGVTAKGRCTIHEDAETKAWFYPAFSAHLNPGSEDRASDFTKMLDSPLRVVLEVVPEKFITYDGVKMARHTAGKLDESELAQPSNSDTERLEKELSRRGLS